jgi:hypothetical protein
MKRALKWLGISLGGVVLVIGLAYGGMRVHDGPVEFWPWFTISIGGPFRSGDVVASPSDWSFLRDREEVEFQTLSPSTSRTVWVTVVDGRLFIVSGYMNSVLGRLWKQWPAYMDEDNRVLLRVDGRIYEQRLDRITGGPDIAPVMAELGRKYAGGSGEIRPGSEVAVTSGSIAMFEVVPR